MNGSVQERVILSKLKDPVLIAAFATPTKGGSTAVSALSYLAQEWKAEPVSEFGTEQLYSYARIRPQLQTAADGQRSVQWPTNTVYLAEPEGTDRSFLLLVGVEPSFGWNEFIEAIQGFCRRNNVGAAITLHSMPAGVSHRQEAPVAGIYSSNELQASFGLPATVFQDGPLSFGALLSLNLNAQGLKTVDLIALEPFYTSGLPDAGAALALVRALDRHFGTRTPVESLGKIARDQREVYEVAMADDPHMRALADHLEKTSTAPKLLDPGDSEISVKEVMDEVERIFSSS